MKQKIFLLLGFAISIASLYFVFKDIDFALLWQALQSFNPLWMLPMMALFFLSMWVRAARWGFFFRPHFRLTGNQLFGPMMVGFAFNDILPSGRVGEVIRAFLVGTKYKTGLPTALATIVTERIIDGLTILVMLGISLALLPAVDESTVVEFWGFRLSGADMGPLIRKLAVMCVILVVGVAIFMIPAFPRLLIRIVEAMPVFSAQVKDLAIGFVHGLTRGFESVRGWRILSMIILYSIAVWALIALSNYVLVFGFPGLRMNYLHSVAIMSFIAIFIIIPAAPGYWGLFEAGALFSMKVMGLAEDMTLATAYVLVLHILHYVPVIIVGLIFAAQSQVKVSRISKEATKSSATT